MSQKYNLKNKCALGHICELNQKICSICEGACRVRKYKVKAERIYGDGDSHKSKSKNRRKTSRKSRRKTNRKKNNKTNKKNRKTTRKTRRKIRKTKKTRKSKISKVSRSIKDKIIDVPFSKSENKGTKASKNVVNYHYQHLNNINIFLHKLLEKKHIKNVVFFNSINDSILQIQINEKKIYPYFISITEFKNNLDKCIKNKNRFIPIPLNSELPQGSYEIENHANIILIDKQSKNIEIFEPHGYKPKMSTLSQSVTKYHNKIKIIKLFFKKLLPEYNLVNVVDYIKDKNSFQSKYDSNSGYCVTWSALYCHYRLLNPDVPIPMLIDYLHKLMNTNLLLRYAHYIEDILKN